MGGLQCIQLHFSDGTSAMEGEPLLEYLAGFEVVVVGVPCELRVQSRLLPVSIRVLALYREGQQRKISAVRRHNLI